MSEVKYPDAVNGVNSILETVEKSEAVEITIDDASISDLIDDYVETRIDPEDAVRYVAKDILESLNVDDPSQYTRGGSGRRRAGSTGNNKLSVEEIDEPDQWIEFEGTVLETFDTTNGNIDQQGRLADDSGTIRFTIWESDGVTTQLEQGKSYNFEPVVVNEFQDELELKIANVTEITELRGDDALGIDPDEYTEKISGAIIKFQEQMGLIDRCPNEDCRRVLQEPIKCPDCGVVDSEPDLRTKAVIDTGTDTWTIFLGEEHTERLTHIDLEEAERMADEHDDSAVVTWAIKEELHGEYLELWGRDRGRRFDVEDFELAPSPGIEELQKMQEKLNTLP